MWPLGFSLKDEMYPFAWKRVSPDPFTMMQIYQAIMPGEPFETFEKWHEVFSVIRLDLPLSTHEKRHVLVSFFNPVTFFLFYTFSSTVFVTHIRGPEFSLFTFSTFASPRPPLGFITLPSAAVAQPFLLLWRLLTVSKQNKFFEVKWNGGGILAAAEAEWV